MIAQIAPSFPIDPADTHARIMTRLDHLVTEWPVTNDLDDSEYWHRTALHRTAATLMSYASRYFLERLTVSEEHFRDLAETLTRRRPTRIKHELARLLMSETTLEMRLICCAWSRAYGDLLNEVNPMPTPPTATEAAAIATLFDVADQLRKEVMLCA